ncbi:transglycosylase family protein [Nocardioides sp. SYSU DS0651]|uniref:transglycosylase family protein n=1 Tax=Nocardioides sp. SYSU DS0651 TaxID=3415955 RepID=UPI003F4B1F8F
MRLAHPTLSLFHKLTRSRVAIVATLAAILLAVSGVTYGYTSMSNEVTLAVDGEERSVTTMGDTVEDVLRDEGVDVGERDLVQPELDEEIDEGDKIAVVFAKPIELTVDGETSTHWVTATDVQGALAQIGTVHRDSRLSTSRGMTLSRDGASIEVVTPKKLTFRLAGKKPVKREVTALTVEEALDQVGVELDRHDVVRPKPGKTVADGDRIVFTDIEVKKRDVEGEAVEAPVRRVEDDSMLEGRSEVVEEGADGRRDVTYRLTVRNGDVVRRVVVRQDVTKQPQARVVRVGTKEPAPEPAPNYAGGGTVWDRLAQCESGGNWATNTGNGYYGGLQFSAATWRSVGGSGLPHQHSREEQIRRGQILQSRAGWGQWPHCSAQLGLR